MIGSDGGVRSTWIASIPPIVPMICVGPFSAPDDVGARHPVHVRRDPGHRAERNAGDVVRARLERHRPGVGLDIGSAQLPVALTVPSPFSSTAMVAFCVTVGLAPSLIVIVSVVVVGSLAIRHRVGEDVFHVSGIADVCLRMVAVRAVRPDRERAVEPIDHSAVRRLVPGATGRSSLEPWMLMTVRVSFTSTSVSA